MKILVTGASGFLGKNLLVLLKHEEDLHLSALVHRRVLGVGGCEAVPGDLNDPASLSRAVEGMDMVVHLAALTRSHRKEDYYEINAKGTKNLVNVCVRHKVGRFIYVSSRAAHADGGAYAHSKLLAEDYVKQSDLSWVIIRPSEVYGLDGGDAVYKLVVVPNQQSTPENTSLPTCVPGVSDSKLVWKLLT